MARRLIAAALLCAAFTFAQKTPAPEPVEPPEEDVGLAPKEYGFNPVQAEKEIRIGNYYFKKGNYRAASMRFREAAKWNPSAADAYLRLGESLEKARDAKEAQQAFAKYLELAPDAKNAAEIKKKLESAPAAKNRKHD